MNDKLPAHTISRAPLILRLILGMFLLQWGIENFVVPQNTISIWACFYGLNAQQ